MTALIWDLDGTLLDSYKVIVECTLEVLREHGVTADPLETHRRLIASSVKAFLSEQNLDADELWRRYQALSTARDDEVTLIPGARRTLEELRRMGAVSFVYTHKGPTAGKVLERLGIAGYFTHILTAQSGLPRKPAPDGINWLVEQYNLDKCKTFYIGDRRIDVECAENSGVRCILYLPPSGVGSPTGREYRVVSGLTEIPEIISAEDRD